MPTSADISEVTRMLKENRVQEAADLSAKLSAEAKAAEDLAAGKPAEPPPPRARDEIFSALLHEFAAHLGYTPRMAALISELDEAESRTH